jgi:tight adherence protein B
MIWLAALTAMLCVALLAWRAYAWFRPALGRYRQVYIQETGIKLTEVFLFIDPAQLWLAAIVCCVFAGASIFVVTGSGVLALIV